MGVYYEKFIAKIIRNNSNTFLIFNEFLCVQMLSLLLPEATKSHYKEFKNELMFCPKIVWQRQPVEIKL